MLTGSKKRIFAVAGSLLIALFVLFTFLPYDAKAETVDQRFSDISNAYWAKDEVTQLVEEGIINGYQDLQYRPGISIKRGQAANLLTAALKLPQAPYQPIFKDVSSKSSHLRGAMATYQEGIFKGKPDGNFGVSDELTREQMASVLVNAFKLKDTGEEVHFTDEHKISESHRYGVKVLMQHGITTGKEDGSFAPKLPVNRGSFAVFLHRAMIQSGLLEKKQPITFNKTQTMGKFEPIRFNQFLTEVPLTKEGQTYLRSNHFLSLAAKRVKPHGHATDHEYVYGVSDRKNTRVTVTKRELPNGDYFTFVELRNPDRLPLRVDFVRIDEGVTANKMERFDKFPMKKDIDDTFGFDIATSPVGVLETVSQQGTGQQMISKMYRSRDLEMKYRNGAISRTRELYDEQETYSNIVMGNNRVSVFELHSRGYDIVDHWYLASDQKLFSTNERLDSWLRESVANYKKRNKWYTANGPYNKMATTIEPMPASGRGYGRNLLLVKEDRVMLLYNQTEERYYEDILHNAFTNLSIFRGNKTYWETEVTSTYLQHLYNFTAPFVDTRFNEQIALFLYNGGSAFGHKDYNEGLRNYANLLVQQHKKGNVNALSSTAYYIPDYFPAKQQVKTHTSMNHLLGGMNILLLAFQEFKDPVYLENASAIEKAIRFEEKKWTRSNGDIWYKRAPNGQFSGTDYVHLTLEDLIHSYEMWMQVDQSKAKVFERMIKSKAGYLNSTKKGYTTKIKKGLERINMSNLLPAGPEYTDAL
ncbi:MULTISPECIES: S-layer homology domain-containing protein [unclassified Sporosarcina]|uniref:S-layer homology domain-containing protein n=1 Tax=unclassified Sporosarcina TaxID=2647733 RepID=UPI000A19DE23|nr:MULTISPECIES: S-layer homology domain-containing protein [unclassified Sporosarcina]PID18988.1 S-layer homology domain-containing protein [Sporosarcina sp. P35]